MFVLVLGVIGISVVSIKLLPILNENAPKELFPRVHQNKKLLRSASCGVVIGLLKYLDFRFILGLSTDISTAVLYVFGY
jgi:hypothetical protein